MNLDMPFEYRECRFICSVVELGGDLFQPHVLYQFGVPGVEQVELPRDSEPYSTSAEALRHAQQQAVRWVHDRIGDGQGQF